MRRFCALVALAMLLSLGARQPIATSAVQRIELPGVRVLAVAPFDDEWYAPDLALYGPARLTQLVSKGPYRTVPPSEVAGAMKRLSMTPRDLISPSRTIELGTALGADAVLTGRITYALREKPGPREDSTNMADGGSGSRVDVDIRILNVKTREKPLEQQFSCHLEGSLQMAMDCVMRDTASRLVP